MKKEKEWRRKKKGKKWGKKSRNDYLKERKKNEEVRINRKPNSFFLKKFFGSMESPHSTLVRAFWKQKTPRNKKEQSKTHWRNHIFFIYNINKSKD
jgi:hypothetical protein